MSEVLDILKEHGFFTNADFPFECQILDEAGAPVDITGWELSWVLKKRKSVPDAQATVSKETGDGITITDGPNGVCLIDVVAADTDASVKDGVYVHELKRTDTKRVLLPGLAVLQRSAHLS